MVQTAPRGFWLVAAMIWLAQPAAATPVSITFDQGGFDPNPAACDYHGPYDYLESGARVQGFWLQDYGQPSAEARCGHTHLDTPNFPGSSGDAALDHPWTDGVLGLYISLEDGSAFDVLSIDSRIRYRWSDKSNFERPDWSVSENDVHMLLSASFNPASSLDDTLAEIEAQFTAYSIDDGSIGVSGDGSEARPGRPASSTPFITTQITDFTGITGLYILSTGSTNFDNIVLDPVPEPSTALMLGLGFVILGARRLL